MSTPYVTDEHLSRAFPRGTPYVCGFLFHPDHRVVLVRKRRPFWQAGLLNGVGGKIEPGETPHDAMKREATEETGYLIPKYGWRLFHVERWANGNSVHFLTALVPTDRVRRPAVNDERIIEMHWRHLDSRSWSTAGTMYNLPYLVPMAFCHLHGDPGNLPYHT